MSAYKKLNQQDAYITTYTARKSWIASGSQYRELGIQNIVGLSGSGQYSVDNSDLAYGGNIVNSGSTSYNKRLLFESNHHLYYSSFSGSILPTSSSYENYLQSSFEVSGSRHLNTRVAVFSLPKEMYGVHIEPLSISITPDFMNSGSAESGSFDNYVINNYATDEGVDSILSEDNLYIENIDFLFSATGATCVFPKEDYIEEESTYVDETQDGGGEYLDIKSGVSKNCNEIVDDGEGRLYLKHSSPRYYVGNAIYPHGQLIITDDIIAMYYNHYFDAVLKWKSNLPIFTHNYHCRLKTNEFNHTLNKTALENTDGQIANNISGSAFQPYITTVGLYNDSNELVAVGKMGQPLPKSGETDTVILTKFDMNFGVNRLQQGYIVDEIPEPTEDEEPEEPEDTPIFSCDLFFTFQNIMMESGTGIYSSNGNNIGIRGIRRVRDFGEYRLYRRQAKYNPQIPPPNPASYSIPKNHEIPFPGSAIGIYIAEKNFSNLSTQNLFTCYTDVLVKMYISAVTQTVSYTYHFDDVFPENTIYPTENLPYDQYLGDTSPYPRRSAQFFKDVLEPYLLTDRHKCGWTSDN